MRGRGGRRHGASDSIPIVDTVRCARDVGRLQLAGDCVGDQVVVPAHEPLEAPVAKRLRDVRLAPSVDELVEFGGHRLCDGRMRLWENVNGMVNRYRCK